MDPQRTVGILGGGQLARMLAEAAHRLGLVPVPLAESPDEPAAQVCPQTVVGSIDDPEALERFFARCPRVVFENEFVDCDRLERAARGRVEFLPGLAAIRRLQDKLQQKQVLAELGIPNPPFRALDGGRDAVRGFVEDALAHFEGECVFKWARLGYDGKGTLIGPVDADVATAFCERALDRGVPLYVEQKVAFRRELSVVASYSLAGELAAYPLVVSEQQDGICKRVTGPATALGVDPRLERAAHEHARRLAERLSLFGTFAIELLHAPDDEIWVNEIAPRVHNTGHFSQDAAATSQFENHWRAVLRLPLGPTATAPAFAMLNLLGPADVAPGPADRVPEPGAHAHLHWYGKRELRDGRKMGHLNGSAASAAELPALLDELRDLERRWIDAVHDR